MKMYSIGFMVPKEYGSDILRTVHTVCGGEWNAVDPIALHITTHYLGRVADEDLSQLQALIGCIVEDFSPLKFENGRLSFMKPYKPYMLWVTFAPNMWVTQLSRECERRVGRLGEKKDEHNRIKSPHITIARLPRGIYAPLGIHPPELDRALTSVRVDTLALWCSENGTHKVVKHWKL